MQTESNPFSVLKYCPRCGSSRFERNSDRSLLCADCRFHYFINSAAAAAALIVNDNDELLLTVRAFDPDKGKLDLPGGFVDPRESVEMALKREIKEELNLDVADIQFVVSFPNEYVFSGMTVYTTDMAFLCKIGDFAEIRCADDVAGYKFINIGKIDYSQIGATSIREIIRYFSNNYKTNTIDDTNKF